MRRSTRRRSPSPLRSQAGAAVQLGPPGENERKNSTLPITVPLTFFGSRETLNAKVLIGLMIAFIDSRGHDGAELDTCPACTVNGAVMAPLISPDEAFALDQSEKRGYENMLATPSSGLDVRTSTAAFCCHSFPAEILAPRRFRGRQHSAACLWREPKPPAHRRGFRFLWPLSSFRSLMDMSRPHTAARVSRLHDCRGTYTTCTDQITPAPSPDRPS